MAKTNSADAEPETVDVQNAIASQAIFAGQHEELLQEPLSDSYQAMVNQMSQLSNQVAMLSSQLSSPVFAAQAIQHVPLVPPPVSAPPRGSHIPDLEAFTGCLQILGVAPSVLSGVQSSAIDFPFESI